MPDAIADQLNRDILRALQLPDVQERMNTLGMITSGTSRADAKRYIASEIAKWAEVVKQSGAAIN